ncbi:uncharacterized protein LOC113285470 isoform X1 [Papaver somniferum]|uniref:uncharacterized protein LOC113285470 isoform X1 n=1 Tax=Papaver somniferum TaxID=3469 RepID=UPI000E6F4E41|nr:uncharacterized protein LOC113285470 isoform X1 [Papaver somniferum]
MLKDLSFGGLSEIKNSEVYLFYAYLQEKESPTGEIYRPDVFLKTHKVTPDDNTSSSKSMAAAKLALVKEEYDKDPSAQKCLGTDAVTKVARREAQCAERESEKRSFEKHSWMLKDRKTTLEYMIRSLIALVSRILGS